MGRSTTSTATLAVLGALTLLMLFLGFRWTTEPFPDALGNEEPPVCEFRTVAKGAKVLPEDVTVSVYNSSKRSGLASNTMVALMERGFGKGISGNVTDVEVAKVEVWADSTDNPAARLVRSQFGKGVRINTEHPEIGAGVVVVVGPDYKRLSNSAAKFATAGFDTEICSPTEVFVE